MERYRRRRHHSPHCGENDVHRKKVLGSSIPCDGEATPGPQRQDAERKNKFNLNIKSLTDDVLDRFASIRVPGGRRGRPLLPNLKHAQLSSGDWGSALLPEYSSKQLPEKEVILLFEKMMEDMNLSEERKAPLREKDMSTKREMVVHYIGATSNIGSLKNRQYNSTLPHEFIHELKSGVADEKLLSSLESLRVSLTSNPISWVGSFGNEGLSQLLDILEKLLNKKHPEKNDCKSQHQVIQCLRAFMNNKYGLERILGEERSIFLLARAIDPKQPNMMTDAIKLLSAICIVGEENILENVLEAITTAGELRKWQRFYPIVEGLHDTPVQLKVACMQLINALVTTPDDLDLRIHLRNEFVRCGLREILPELRLNKNDALDIQLKVFDEHKEEDMIEFSHRLEDVQSELDEMNDVYNMLLNTVKDTEAESYFLSILQHMLLIRNDYFVRPQYFKIIEECVSQIVLHHSGMDPDFTYRKRLNVDFDHLVDVCVDKARVDECEQRLSELTRKFEEEFTARQEAQTQMQKKEEKINELEAEVWSLRAQLSALPPNLRATMTGVMNDNSPSPTLNVVPPPSLSSLTVGPLPPPPPPPLPPPPPPLPPPPPVTGFKGGHWSPTPHSLPHGLKPKKEFKLDINMKRVNWCKIRPLEMPENCFWIKANDGKYESPDLFARIGFIFGAQKRDKKDEEYEEKKNIKKRIKELKVLDPKVAQNLSIFLGSFRMPYEEIKRIILEVDEEQLTESMIQNLVNHLPEQEQVLTLARFKNDYGSLSEPEQFGVVMSSVKKLRPRLNAILFKLQFEEQVNNIRPDIMAVTAVCEEIKKSKSFGNLLELVLLIGNYMNAGSRNAQTYGFNINFLCKLNDTKSADQKTTFLHFLAQICEEKHPDLLKFTDHLQNVDKASKVCVENLEKNLKQMEKQLQQLEKDLETFPPPDDLHDKFVTKMSSFASHAREEYHKLANMHRNMEKLYHDLMHYFVINPKKVTAEEVFSDISNFRSMFMQAIKENVKRREAEEKLRRAKLAKEKVKKEKQERQQKKRHLLEKNSEGDETGVMDSLLEALQSGTAFRDRRKWTPRPKDTRRSTSPGSQWPAWNQENQKAQREKSRSGQNVHLNTTRIPIAKELSYETEGHSSTTRSKAVKKREGHSVLDIKEKEMRPVISSARGDAVPEVEALLARLRAL
ncbi:protein diaphanous homolog 3-like [Heterodontus francisci]|uniref:protein diaphanous homolog 3-like n=1 Tax=Heterodontus francisci TaxID=7792 RepID=UPI00355BA433